jgi:hypothetical protein
MRGQRFVRPPHDGIIRHGDVVSTVARVSPLIRHWGVWDGRRQEMIHAQLPVVSTSSWAEFDHRDSRVEIPAGLAGDVIVERARSQIGLRYNVLYANCEQFARWAATGKAESRQLQRAAVGLGAAALGLWAVLGDHGTYDSNGRLRDKKGRFM